MRLATVESKFADIIWSHEPLKTKELTILCEEALGWKRSTTYTVLKKFRDRGLFGSENGLVVAKVSRKDFYALCSEEFVTETFAGSFPAFVEAFTSRNKLTAEEAGRIQELITASIQ